MMPSVTTRSLTPKDGVSAAGIFFDAVHNGTADVYSAAQRRAWAGDAPDPAGWRHRFDATEGFAADIDGALVGFMTLDAQGYIDLAFVRADHSGRGIGQRLYNLIEAHAAAQGIERLTTEASKKAKSFFLRRGWQVDHEQSVVKNGVSLVNYKMSKILKMKD